MGRIRKRCVFCVLSCVELGKKGKGEEGGGNRFDIERGGRERGERGEREERGLGWWTTTRARNVTIE